MTISLPRRRAFAILVAGTALLLCGQLLHAAAPASRAEVAPAPAASEAPEAPVAARAALVTSTAHPFSNPIWFPVRQPVRMDCYRGNPGCRPPDTNAVYHTTYQLTLNVPATDNPGGVFAMGAGIVRQVVRGDRCGEPTRPNLGNEVVIDHGGGIETRYGHLASFASGLRPGTRVAAGQRIGTIGNSGAAGNGPGGCRMAYLDFFIQRVPGNARLEFKTLRACVSGETQTWPRAQHPQYPTFNQLPKDLWQRGSYRLPHVDNPTDVPDDTCLPTAAPATPNRPAAPRVVGAGRGKLRVSWAVQPAGTSAVLEVQHYRRSSRTWQRWGYVNVPAGRKAAVLTGRNALRRGMTTRVFLSYRNGTGLSAPSRPTARTTP